VVVEGGSTGTTVPASAPGHELLNANGVRDPGRPGCGRCRAVLSAWPGGLLSDSVVSAMPYHCHFVSVMVTSHTFKFLQLNL